jgi:hypothetical protein
MKHKFTRTVKVFAVLALVLMSFAGAALADDDEVDLPHFTDRRINNFDINAPVAIYATYSYPYADDINMGVLDNLEFWGVLSDGNIDKVLDVTAEEILAVDNSEERAVVETAFGYTLYRETDGSLTLVGPNVDGSIYQFNWEQSYN